jgi:IS5 family transposase
MQRVNAQPTFTDLAVADLGSPKTLQLFQQCSRLIDFEAMAAPLANLYRNNTGKGGASNWPVVLMLKVLFLQKLFNLSDPATEQMILDRLSFRRFLGLSLDDKTPDETTIWTFRERLVTAGRATELFDGVVLKLREQGIILNNGTLIDATIIEAPRGRKRADGSSTADPCASTTCKHGRAYHGYRAHFSTDRRGFVTDFVFDTASVSEHTHFDQLAEKEQKVVFADSGCRSKQRQERMRQRGVKPMLCHRRVRGQKELTPLQKRFNRFVSRIRAFVEHPLAQIKAMLPDGGVARYRTMRRNAADFALCATFANLRRSMRYASAV